MKSLFLEKFKQRISIIGKEGVFSLLSTNNQSENTNKHKQESSPKMKTEANCEKFEINTKTTVRSNKPNFQSDSYLLPLISEKSKKAFFEYSPYSVNDYRRISKDFPLINKNGLGGFIGSEEWEKRKAKKEKLNEYGKSIMKISKKMKKEDIEKRKDEKEGSKRMKGLMYSKNLVLKRNVEYHDGKYDVNMNKD